MGVDEVHDRARCLIKACSGFTWGPGLRVPARDDSGEGIRVGRPYRYLLTLSSKLFSVLIVAVLLAVAGCTHSPRSPKSAPAEQAAPSATPTSSALLTHVTIGRPTRAQVDGWTVDVPPTSSDGTLSMTSKPALPPAATDAGPGHFIHSIGEPIGLELTGAPFPKQGARLTRI